MPNLPGATPAKDLAMFKKLFSNPDFQPDMLKIYPCVVTKNSKLYGWYKQGKFKAYTDKQLLNLLIQIKKNIPPYVRISRLIRDIPNVSIVSGNKISNLRQMIFNKAGKICRCIRCREARNQPVSEKLIKLKVIKYRASDGWEYFLSYESKDGKTLFALLRLRIPQKQDQNLIRELPELKNAAIIREVHTYGKLIPVGGSSKAIQHMGFGKRLIKEAEKISKQQGFKKIAVISGIGVRKYYEKLGYNLSHNYMIKQLVDR